MFRLLVTTVFVAPLLLMPGPSSAQPASAADGFEAGTPLEMTPNARTYGGCRFAESMSYDPVRDLYVAVNAGIAQDVIPNDGYISLVNPDGTAHTLKWIGITRNGLTLNHPLGSDIINRRLYVADIDVIRWFDMESGRPLGSITVENASRFNDIEVASDGTIYATQTGDQSSDTWKVYRVTLEGEATVFADGPRLNRPNGVATPTATSWW